MNSRLGTKQKYLCVSRPRRFGKSYAAQMLCAYYDKTCDSHELFSTCQISADAGYEAHLNRYDVLYLDMTQITGEAGKQNFIDFIRENYIVTTHSPQVLGEADESFKIISLSLDMDENEVGTDQIERMDGFDSNMIAGVFIRHLRMLKMMRTMPDLDKKT